MRTFLEPPSPAGAAGRNSIVEVRPDFVNLRGDFAGFDSVE
jgi:hypothetical protein